MMTVERWVLFIFLTSLTVLSAYLAKTTNRGWIAITALILASCSGYAVSLLKEGKPLVSSSSPPIDAPEVVIATVEKQVLASGGWNWGLYTEVSINNKSEDELLLTDVRLTLDDETLLDRIKWQNSKDSLTVKKHLHEKPLVSFGPYVRKNIPISFGNFSVLEFPQEAVNGTLEIKFAKFSTQLKLAIKFRPKVL